MTRCRVYSSGTTNESTSVFTFWIAIITRATLFSTTVFRANIRGSASVITLVTTPNYLATDECITVHALPVSTRLFTRFLLTLMLIPYKFSTGFIRSRVFTCLLVSPFFSNLWHRLAMYSISAHRCGT